jgi:hypothetical protein
LDIQTGWVRLIPDSGNPTPVGSGMFSYNPDNVLISESGIPSSISTTHARIYVDLSDNHNTGLAVANITSSPASIAINAYLADGTTSVGASKGPLQLTDYGHDAKFADQLISGLPDGFRGVFDISSSLPFAALTLRSLDNERGEFLMTAFPVADANHRAPLPIVFPQIADGGGYVTQFILLSAEGPSATTLGFYGEDGYPMAIGR